MGPVQSPPSAPAEPSAAEAATAGVIKEARARQRRQQSVVVALAVAAFVAVMVAFGSLGGSSTAASGALHRARPSGSHLRATLIACPTPSFSDRTPDPSLLATLGVLRRPATAADAPATLTNSIAARLVFGQVFVNYIRLARVIAGVPYYVMAVRPTACDDPHLWNGQEGVVMWTGPRGYTAGTAATIRQGLSFDQTAIAFARSTIAMVVPDGVATVTLKYPAGPIGGYDHRHAPATTITTKVVGNLLVVTVPRAGLNVAGTTTTWRTANGHTIKTLTGL
jgi:hypothetical protein